jgi:hypothetical protein
MKQIRFVKIFDDGDDNEYELIVDDCGIATFSIKELWSMYKKLGKIRFPDNLE